MSALERLDALWRRYDRGWKRLLSPGVLRELSLRASFDLDLLAPHRIANEIPKGTVPDCPRCEDICCAGLENLVSLRLRDVAVLIDLDRTDLISVRKPRFPPGLVRARPALHELMGSELWLTLPVLKQVGERRICAALTAEMQCSLYPSWPLSCDRFPYTLSARRRVVWGSRCASKQCGPEHEPRHAEMFEAAVDTFNERVRDAVLLAHARPALDEIGIGRFLSAPAEAFEVEALPIVE